MELADEGFGAPLALEAQGELALLSPPRRDPLQLGATAWLQYLFPVVGSLGSLLFVLSNPKPLFIAAGILFAVGSVAMGVVMGIQQRLLQRKRTASERTRYLMHLSQLRQRVRAAQQHQRQAATRRHPAPQALPAVVRSGSRLWERQPNGEDFLQLRVGSGKVGLLAALRLPPMDDLPGAMDPVCVLAARRFVQTHQNTPGHPLTVDLRRQRTLSIAGPRAAVLDLARALVAQLAVFHSPDDVGLLLGLTEATRVEWDWCKWLPHLRSRDGVDGTGGVSMGAAGLEQALAGRAAGARPTASGKDQQTGGAPWLLAIADGVVPSDDVMAVPRRDENSRVALIVVGHDPGSWPNHIGLRVRLTGGRLSLESADRSIPQLSGIADRLGPSAAGALARHLLPLKAGQGAGHQLLANEISLTGLFGIADAATLDPVERWHERPLFERLRTSIGLNPKGERVILDLKESALDGHGPHGLIIGATGSGKSELLRTMVAGLALTHHPDLLAFVLVDFKGGAAFAGLQGLPHVAGMITNLSDDLAMVDRMHAALFGEMRRRQEMLRAAGNLASLREYHVRALSTEVEPLPYLMVIVDEFGELLTARPEFIDLFVALGRLGRSLGMHLVLSSQQLDEGRLRGLEGHLSYRIALRTFSPQESRVVIGTPDAYELSPIPGSGYLKVGTTVYTRFRAALASQRYTRPDPEAQSPHPTLYTLGIQGPEAAAPKIKVGVQSEASGASVLDVLVRRLQGAARPVHQVWLPPLETNLTLNSLLGSLQVDPQRGLMASDTTTLGGLAVPLGMVDRPQDQARSILLADMSGAGGHLIVVGAPQTGKSVMLRTLVLGFALTHTPLEAQFYCIDYGGGGLATLADLPHVGIVCGRNDPERLRRTIVEVAGLLDERDQTFQQLGIDSPQALRAARASGNLAGETYADVFLVIDNWPAIRPAFDDLESQVQDIAARGLGYGVHLVITANRWLDVRSALREAIGGRLELRLNDPSESAVDRRTAANVPPKVPGRGLTNDGLHFQTALPRLDGRPTAVDLQRSLEQAVGRVRAAWQGAQAPPVRVLPRMVRAEGLAPSAEDPRAVPLGISERDLRPIYVNLQRDDPHFLIFGDRASGKTSLLRTFLRGLVSRYTTSEIQVVAIDYRRTLLDVVPANYLASYSGAAPAAASQITEAAQVLKRRLPGPEVTVEQLRARSWWSGPQVYVVVDDYDLVATTAGNPLFSMQELLPQAQDIGLHLLLARRAGGASRGILEPMLLALRELGSPGILLSGSPQEGALLGPNKATPQPPGRGLLVRRNERAGLIQVGFSEQ